MLHANVMSFFDNNFVETKLTGNFAQLDQWDFSHIFGTNTCRVLFSLLWLTTDFVSRKIILMGHFIIRLILPIVTISPFWLAKDLWFQFFILNSKIWTRCKECWGWSSHRPFRTSMNSLSWGSINCRCFRNRITNGRHSAQCLIIC